MTDIINFINYARIYRGTYTNVRREQTQKNIKEEANNLIKLETKENIIAQLDSEIKKTSLMQNLCTVFSVVDYIATMFLYKIVESVSHNEFLAGGTLVGGYALCFMLAKKADNLHRKATYVYQGIEDCIYKMKE